MAHHRYTMNELENLTNRELILDVIAERKADCTNYYSPLYRRLTELEKWITQNILEDKER